ncbi:hypothetical protein TNCV_446341 [Trichonephila clavipes]|nr:hypothetical protein TNCV_446341 [Trichonephila clavipes]
MVWSVIGYTSWSSFDPTAGTLNNSAIIFPMYQDPCSVFEVTLTPHFNKARPLVTCSILIFLRIEDFQPLGRTFFRSVIH